MNPSTTLRANSERSPMRARSAGSRNPAGAVIASEPGPRHGDKGQQSLGQMVGRDPFRLRLEVEQHAVAEHRWREGPDIVEADVGAALQQGPGLPAQHQRLRRADARPVGDILLDEVGRTRLYG